MPRVNPAAVAAQSMQRSDITPEKTFFLNSLSSSPVLPLSSSPPMTGNRVSRSSAPACSSVAAPPVDLITEVSSEMPSSALLDGA